MKAIVIFLLKYGRPFAIVLVLGGLLYGAYDTGRQSVQRKWDLATSQNTERVAEVKVEQATETVRVVTEYVDRIKIVHVKGETIIKEVPKYVTVQDDSRCGTLGPGFVELWNAANEGRLPDPSRIADAGPSGPEERKAEGESAPQ